MQQRIKHLLKANSLLIALFITALIGYLSLVSLGYDRPIKISHLDKIEHAIAYFFLGVSWLVVSTVYKTKFSKKRIVVFGCIIYGIIIEILQETITLQRTADILDVLADIVGVLLGLLIFNQFSKKNTVI